MKSTIGSCTVRRFFLNMTLCAAGALTSSCSSPGHIEGACPSTVLPDASQRAFLRNALESIEQQIPELATARVITGLPSSASVWNGQERASAGFYLRANPRHPAMKFSRGGESSLVDVHVALAQYVSSDEAKQDVEASLRQRAAVPPPARGYRDGVLFRYSSGAGTAICQHREYVVEVWSSTESAQPFIMKVLDVVLNKIDSAGLDFK